ncbi:hypothetical protein RCC89_20190 [Cytophagaceae bacterium ABcell3]|nr:hypothetical protein RCC89_20190 [Cytophagaceae bacterium ABcell3]
MAKKSASKKQPKVNPDLNGFSIQVNTFGEIVSSYNLDEINKFLDKNVDDKKLKNRIDSNPEENSGDISHFKKEQ